jgi:nucleoside-diphosphate-sugar epimerase
MNVILCGANGYIGSRVYEVLNKDFNFFPIDNLIVKRDKLRFVNIEDYRKLSSETLNKFDVCLWLGGHSSVKQSIDNPQEAFNNNTTGLIELSNKFDGSIIYASSGSIYNNFTDMCTEEDFIYSATNIYDFSKFVTDEYFKLNNNKFISLRFGTVNGFSSSFRQDLLLNKLSLDSIKNNKIFISNQNAFRPVLFLEDLIKCIRVLLQNHLELRKNIFNLCSMNYTIGEYANSVKKYFNSNIEILESSKTYSFKMSSEKFRKLCNVKFSNDIDEILNNLKINLS